MMLERPLIGRSTQRSIDVPFYVCEYHWGILNYSFQRYLIDVGEAESQARHIAMACPDCETPKSSR